MRNAVTRFVYLVLTMYSSFSNERSDIVARRLNVSSNFLSQLGHHYSLYGEA